MSVYLFDLSTFLIVFNKQTVSSAKGSFIHIMQYLIIICTMVIYTVLRMN